MSPTPAQIRAARTAAGLSQRQAAEVVMSATRSWEDWEAGRRNMPAAKWALFALKVGATTQANPVAGPAPDA